MTSRISFVCACAIALGCGSTRSAPARVETPIEAPVEARERAAPPSEPVAEASSEESATSDEAEAADDTALTPIDDRAAPCFADPRATPHVIGQPFRHPEGPFLATIRASAPARDASELRARPGQIVRFDLALENVSGEPIVLTENDLAQLRALSVTGASAVWRLPLDRELHSGALAPGAVLRLCASFDVGRSPIDAAPPENGELRAYTVDFPGSFSLEMLARPPRGYVSSGRVTIVVRYPRSRARAVREPESWGGVIALELAEGASILTIAREAGVRVGSGIPLFRGREEAMTGPVSDGTTYVQAPPEMRVRDAAAALAARSDVLSATPVMRGDPGTEGCSAFEPCPRGHACCYMCGIPGCPNSCASGPTCPGNIP